MPISRNNASRPNVRASSGMIGTMRLPMFLSRSKWLNRRTKAIVVDASARPEPLTNSAKLAKLFFVQLFLLVRDVAAFTGFAQAVAFYRFGENDRGLTLVFHCGLVGGVHLSRVMTAAQQFVNLVVGQVV